MTPATPTSRTSTTFRSSTGARSPTSSRSTRTLSPASRWRTPIGRAATRPTPRSKRPAPAHRGLPGRPRFRGSSAVRTERRRNRASRPPRGALPTPALWPGARPDLLLGRQTRPHADLDVWAPAHDFEGLLAAFAAYGVDRIHPWPGDRPWNFVLHDGNTRRGDLHVP